MTGKKWKPGRRSKDQTSPEILDGIAAIAMYIGKSYSTTARWIKFFDLPAMKQPNGRWMSSKQAITAWIIAGGNAERKARGWDKDTRPMRFH